MNYTQILATIKEAAELVVGSGRFTNIRRADGTLDLEPPYPIINLASLRLSRNAYQYGEGIRPWSVSMNFLKNDSPDNSQEIMEEIIGEMFNMSESFLALIMDNAILSIDNIQGTHERRPLQGQFSGWSINFTLNTKKQC
jgi:hypothetical protein